MSTYSPDLRIELITNGTQAGVWGDTTNRNLGTIIEQAIAGYQAVTTATQKYALTIADAFADEARNAVLAVNTSYGAAYQIYAPPSAKTYIVRNDSAYDVTFYNSTANGNTTAAGLGVTIVAGKTLQIYTNGTNFYSAGAVGVSTNTPGTLVQRDASGNFAAGAISATTFTGALSGNVSGNASGSSSSLATSNWTVSEVSGAIYFKYNGVNKMKLDSSGNITAVGNVTAYGTIT
jgi:hypothetical protein